MRNSLEHLLLAVKIWLVAAGLNGLLTAVLTILFMSASNFIGVLLLVTIFGAIFSIPCLIIILITLRIGYHRIEGTLLFWLIIAVGLFTTIILLEVLGVRTDDEVAFVYGTALISGATSISMFRRSIIQWGSDYHII